MWPELAHGQTGSALLLWLLCYREFQSGEQDVTSGLRGDGWSSSACGLLRRCWWKKART
jgi:hypothetical protein